MSAKKPKKIKPKKITNYAHPKGEPVFQITDSPIEVAPGDTVDILIPGPRGFTVYLPIGEHFNAQIFEAIENPEWAQAEMEAASGSGTEGEDVKFWGVRMIRTSKKFDSGEVDPQGKPIRDFPYCIYSKELKNFAVANSPPKMELDP